MLRYTGIEQLEGIMNMDALPRLSPADLTAVLELRAADRDAEAAAVVRARETARAAALAACPALLRPLLRWALR